MAYAAEYLEALKEKKLEGLFVNDYFLQDKCLNAMQFNNGATVNAAGGLSYTVVRNEKVDNSGKARAFGTDYETVNANPVPETFYLTVLGGKYSVDSTQEDIIKMVNAENEAREKMNAAKGEFARQLIKGKGSNNEFVGMDKFCGDNGLVSDIVLDITGGIKQETAEIFHAQFVEVVGELNVDANAIFASRAMASKLVAIQSILQKYTAPITIGKINYDVYATLPIIPIDNAVGMKFTAVDEEGLEVGAIYEDIFVARLDVNDGVFCGSPVNKAAFVKVVKPVETGSPIATGYVDFVTCLVPKNKGAIRKARVKITDKPVG